MPIISELPDREDLRASPVGMRVQHDVLMSLVKPGVKFWATVAIMSGITSVGIACEVYQYEVGLGAGNFDKPHMLFFKLVPSVSIYEVTGLVMKDQKL